MLAILMRVPEAVSGKLWAVLFAILVAAVTAVPYVHPEAMGAASKFLGGALEGFVS